MELVLDENGNVVLKDGCPVYKFEDGSESPFDAKATLEAKDKKIANLTEEKTRLFTKAEGFKADLKKFDGVDIEAAKEAIETVKNIKSKDLMDANGIKILKSEMTQGFEKEKSDLKDGFTKQIEQEKRKTAEKDSIIKNLLIRTKFANSPHFTGENRKTIYPPDDAVKIFGDRFIVDDKLNVFAVDSNGEVLKSQKTHGEPADFEEAMTRIIEEHPNRERILFTKPGGPLAGGNLGKPPKGGYKSATEQIAAGLKNRYPGKFER